MSRKHWLAALVGLIIGALVVLLVGLVQLSTFDIFRP